MLIDLAINILWLEIGIIVLLGIIWLALYAIKQFVAVPPPVEKAIYLIALILILIAGLTLLAGRGGLAPSFFRRGAAIEITSGPVAALSAPTAGYHAG